MRTLLVFFLLSFTLQADDKLELKDLGMKKDEMIDVKRKPVKQEKKKVSKKGLKINSTCVTANGITLSNTDRDYQKCLDQQSLDLVDNILHQATTKGIKVEVDVP